MGLVIINADVLGLDVATTDAILDCFRADRITSASAMVWMSDSQRAASLAEECEIPPASPASSCSRRMMYPPSSSGSR